MKFKLFLISTILLSSFLFTNIVKPDCCCASSCRRVTPVRMTTITRHKRLIPLIIASRIPHHRAKIVKILPRTNRLRVIIRRPVARPVILRKIRLAR